MQNSSRILWWHRGEQFLLVCLLGGLGFLVWQEQPSVAYFIAQKELFGALAIGVLLLMVVQNRLGKQLSSLTPQPTLAADDAFTSLYERSPVPYLTITQKGVIVAFNTAAINVLRSTTTTLAQANFFSMLAPMEGKDESVIIGKAYAGATITDEELLLNTESGEQLWVRLSAFPHQSNQHMLVAFLDITQEKIVDTAKSEFVALATHQLRTPIAAIRWNVELLQAKMKDTITEDQTRYIVKIERNVLRMLALINDFLSVSKLEIGTFATKNEQVDMTEFFDNIMDEYSEKMVSKQLVIQRFGTPEHALFNADPRLLHIIVSNLLSNAVKYVGHAGEVSAGFELINEHLKITVSDNGIGIPKDEIEKLFVKFFRASNAQAHQAEGTGLGLYVVKQSVEKLGGSIAVTSDKDQGARFEVTLPVRGQE